MKKILLSLAIIGVAAAIAVGVTVAYFSDTETSAGNAFTSGTLNLKLDGGDVPVTMFSVSNVVPGQTGFQEVVLNNAGNINGFVDFNFSNIVDLDNGCNDPETNSPDTTCTDTASGEGELAENLTITAYIDEDNSDTYNLGDTLVYQGLVGSLSATPKADYAFNASANKSFRIEWIVAPSVGNIIQSDSTGFDVQFELGQDISQ